MAGAKGWSPSKPRVVWRWPNREVTGAIAARGPLLAVVVIGLVLRVGLVVATPHFRLIDDAADYQLHGQAISQGFGFPLTAIASPGTPSAFRPPAYPFLLGGAYAVFGIHPNLGRLIGAILGALVVLLTGLLGEALWDRRLGLIGAAVTAVWPGLIVLNGTLVSESLFLPFELAFVLTVLHTRRTGPRLRPAVSAGALCALAAMTRTVGILFLLPALAAQLSAPDGDRGTRLRACGAVLLACAACLAPWAIRNAEVFHAFVPLNTQGGLTLAGQYNVEAGRDDSMEAIWRDFPYGTPELARQLAPLYRRPGGINEVELDSRLTSDALTYLKDHPSHFVIATVLDALRMFDLGKGHSIMTADSDQEMNVPHGLRTISTLSVQLLALIVLIGALARAARRLPSPVRPGAGLVWLTPLIAFLATIPTSGTPRYRAIIDPFLILFATYACSCAYSGLRRSGRIRA